MGEEGGYSSRKMGWVVVNVGESKKDGRKKEKVRGMRGGKEGRGEENVRKRERREEWKSVWWRDKKNKECWKRKK